jgi:hypothetical protein
MSTAEAARDGGSDEGEHADPQRARVPPPLLLLASPWLLRVAAVLAVVAGAAGLVIAPGLHGNTSEPVVLYADAVSAVLAYCLGLLLDVLIVWGNVDLVRSRGVGVGVRAALVAAGATVVACSSPGLRGRLEPVLAVIISAAAAVAAIAAAYRAAGAPHTRAVAAMLFSFAFAAIVRVAAWEIATAAGESASVPLFRMARVLATSGLLFETLGVIVAVTWLATRGRVTGQLGTFAALGLAFVLTLGVARGAHSDASFWESVLHTALADAFGVPPPYGRLDALATLLVPASLLLALVSAIQPKQVSVVVATVALALVSRGSFDAPLRALCAVAAAQWAVLACADPDAMWRTLIDDRKRKLEDG